MCQTAAEAPTASLTLQQGTVWDYTGACLSPVTVDSQDKQQDRTITGARDVRQIITTTVAVATTATAVVTTAVATTAVAITVVTQITAAVATGTLQKRP